MSSPAFNASRELAQFFEWCSDRLVEVLDASGARELWLQAEAHRYFGHHRPGGPLNLWLNAYRRIDLCFYGTPNDQVPSVALELKVLGADYLTKNLTGSASMAPLSSAIDSDTFVFTPEIAATLDPSENSLLKDYKKLLGLPPAITKGLVLVMDKRSTGRLGDALARCEFERPRELLLSTPVFDVCMWIVD